jgi:hypothetical protein
VLGGLGLDVFGETVPYVASWAEHGALDDGGQFAALIDALARRVEAALSATGDQALAHFPSGRFNANAAWTVIACWHTTCWAGAP